MIEERTISKQIRCDCGCGAVLIEGLEIELTDWSLEECPRAFVSLLIWTRAGYGPPPRFWDRVKAAWNFLKGNYVYTTDITLQKKGVEQLHDACKDILDLWPTEEKLKQHKEEHSLTWEQIKEKFAAEND
jgi:hypothetical protein